MIPRLWRRLPVLRTLHAHAEVVDVLEDALGMGWRTRDGTPAGAVAGILRRCVDAQSERDRLRQRVSAP